MDNVITGEEQLKYRVIRGKEILKESGSYILAVDFIDGLSEDEKDGVTIVPVTGSGKTILFG